MWLTPMRFEGKIVWIGQISRDIGVRWTLKSGVLTTHKIDPDVDEARTYLFQDLILSQRVKKIGLIGGVGPTTASEPRKNLTADPYFTVGLRAVFVFSDDRTSMSELQFFDCEFHPELHRYRNELLKK